MGQREEQIVRDYYDKAWVADGTKPDVERIVAAFAPDGVWHVLCPTGPRYVGHDALRTELLRQGTFVSTFTIEPRHVTSNDRVVMMEHVDSFLRKGVLVRACVMSVFELDADGLITENRDYFDSADLGGQGGEDTSSPDWMAG
jgi:limonene-1,2-epoxide hydrolase